MLASYATGAIAVALIAAAWVGVQLAWKRTFPDHGPDPDALAGRTDCHGDCEDDCDRGGHSASCSDASVDRSEAAWRPVEFSRARAEEPLSGGEERR